jgi:acetyl-CoA acyltransferase 1
MNSRLERILAHISKSQNHPNNNKLISQLTVNEKSPDEVVSVCSVRTAMCKSFRGSFKDTHPTDLLAGVLKVCVDKTGINAGDVEDIQVGNVELPGAGVTQARMAMFLAGFPETTSIVTLNRQCSSGLQALANIAAAIKAGFINIGISAGFESMSFTRNNKSIGPINPKINDNPLAKDCLLTMGETSENVSERYGINRREQDEFGVLSQNKAERAQKNGEFVNEIIPIDTVFKTEKEEKRIRVVEDDGIREGTNYESISKLKPAFKENGCSTAGNSSQISDGAAATLLMKRSEANRRGLPILGRFISYAVAGVPPSVMGIGPAFAIPLALRKAGLNVDDIDIYELNEAFASQALYCAKKLNININKINPLGGAIALGHPLGCTGSRQVATLLHYLKRKNLRYGVVSMCVGTGMGAAAVFESE